jgi:hypothetical protein
MAAASANSVCRFCDDTMFLQIETALVARPVLRHHRFWYKAEPCRMADRNASLYADWQDSIFVGVPAASITILGAAKTLRSFLERQPLMAKTGGNGRGRSSIATQR